MTVSAPIDYPFTPRALEIDGHLHAYLDEGQGPAVVMVHGNPSWSYLYRGLAAHLRRDHRVIVPDHLGCGFSDKPQDYPYRLKNHLDNLDQLLETLGIKDCVLVVHDWGGAIGMGWAGRHPDQVRGLVVLNTAAFCSRRIPWRIRICRWPLLGALLVRGLNGFAGAAVHMAVAGKMPRAIQKGFLAPYRNWRDRVAIHRFVQDIPLDPRHPSWPTLKEVEENLEKLRDTPMLICWGGRDFCFNRHFYDEWLARFPDAQAHYFPEAGHYVLEDALVEISPLVDAFLAAHHGGG